MAYTNGLCAHEKTFSIANHQHQTKNKKQNRSELPTRAHRDGYRPKSIDQSINVGEDVEKRGPWALWVDT